MSNILWLFFKEYFDHAFKKVNFFAVIISIIIFSILFLNIFQLSKTLEADVLFYFFFLSYFLLFLVGFLREIYFNQSNKILLFLPGSENKILFKRVLSQTFIILTVLILLNSIIIINRGMGLINVLLMILMIISSFSIAYFIAYFSNRIIILIFLSIFILLLISLSNIINKPLIQFIFIFIMIASTLFLSFLKYYKKLTTENTFFDRFYLKIAHSIFYLSETITRPLPQKAGAFMRKDLYYLFSNLLTLISILLNITLFVIFYFLHFKAHLEINKVLLIAYLLNIFLYSEKCLSLYAGIEKSGTILLKIFPSNYKKIFLLKLSINILFLSITGMVNLICIFHFFSPIQPEAPILLKYLSLLIINGLFFSLISFVMYKLTIYRPELNDFSFAAMLFEQAPIYGKEFIGLLLALGVVVISSVLIYFFNII